ncbi:MAG: hypothetical protein JRI87_10600 [Deltaproteobacteria bacterium]|nr:hypothetical protein [Deltaproteobacteria bacterium]
MEKDSKNNNGLGLLIANYKEMFRIPENVNHYSDKDFKTAERKFLKYALIERSEGRKEVLKMLRSLPFSSISLPSRSNNALHTGHFSQSCMPTCLRVGHSGYLPGVHSGHFMVMRLPPAYKVAAFQEGSRDLGDFRHKKTAQSRRKGGWGGNFS